MNEIQIIQQQLATEKLHFSEVAAACAAAIDAGRFRPEGELAAAIANYFAFATRRISPSHPGQALPGADAGETRWREFLQSFNEASGKHFAAIDGLLTRSLPVTEWRTLSRIDADTIFDERARYQRVKAAIS